jgi:hypothetical protein
MDKITPNVCPVCKEKLTLSRREIVVLGARVKEALKGRYFVPDADVSAIIHKLHSERI